MIGKLRDHHRARKEQLAGRLGEAGKSPWDLARELFRDLEGFDNFLAVSEVVAHLDLLVDEGRAEPSEEDGVIRYRAAG